MHQEKTFIAIKPDGVQRGFISEINPLCTPSGFMAIKVLSWFISKKNFFMYIPCSSGILASID